jgi:broad specificity phosphatase PhoE
LHADDAAALLHPAELAAALSVAVVSAALAQACISAAQRLAAIEVERAASEAREREREERENEEKAEAEAEEERKEANKANSPRRFRDKVSSASQAFEGEGESARTLFAKYRPALSTVEDPRAWWKYLITAVTMQLRIARLFGPSKG